MLVKRFLSKCFHLVISAQKEHLESGIRCTPTCGRFRVWLHFTSPGDCMQTVRKLDMKSGCPWLPFVPHGELIKCCMAAAPSVFIVLCVFTQDSRSWRRSGIEKFSAVQWLYRALCAAVSALAIRICKQRLRFD